MEGGNLGRMDEINRAVIDKLQNIDSDSRSRKSGGNGGTSCKDGNCPKEGQDATIRYIDLTLNENGGVKPVIIVPHDGVGDPLRKNNY